MPLPDDYSLVVNTAPTAEPVTPEELKEHLRVVGGEHNAYIEALGKAARIAVEADTFRAMVDRTYDLTIDEFWSGHLYLPYPPLDSVSSITYIDEDDATQTVTSSVYTVADTAAEDRFGRVYLAEDQSWPTDVESIPRAVTITFVAGFGAASVVPEDFKTMVKIKTQILYDGDPTGKLEDVYQSLRWRRRLEAA